MKLSIIIPAYNEEKRIAKTIIAYDQFLSQIQKDSNLDYEILVVINGSTDNTKTVVHTLQQEISTLRLLNLQQSGKGLAIKAGFQDVLQQKDISLIGFVDADMATSPQAFYDLVQQIADYDGIIASRYMSGAYVWPPRPFIKRWGSKLFFDNLGRLLFGLRYHDTQCGAKLFKTHVIQKIVPHLTVAYWAFDIEILYLCSRFGFTIKEFPTVWYDQAGSKLQTFSAGIRMITTLFKLRWHYWFH